MKQHSTSLFSPSRRNQRRDLLTLLCGLKPGEEIAYEEVQAMTGLEGALSGDRGLIYDVREHCRDVLGFIVDVVPKRGLRRVPDEEVATKTIDRRRDRILRQSLRGAAESVAVSDFAALTTPLQRRLLSHQAIFGTIALASDADAHRLVGGVIERRGLTAPPDPEAVIRAVGKIGQK
jgi:hypothetical protein